jgi:hypothetical protein
MAQKLKFGNGTWATKKGSTLAYNDENNNYKPLPFTTTRNSIGTRVNKEGLIEVVNRDVPRIDYTDSADGVLLLENSATNSLVQSNQFDTTWTSTNATVTSGQIGVGGSVDAWELEKTATNGYIRHIGVSVVDGSISIYAKKGSSNWFRLGSSSGNIEVYFDLNNGIIGNKGNLVDNANITDMGDGWYRCSYSYTGTATGVYLYPADSNGDTSGTSGSVYIQYAQLEQGSYPTSYIPTSGSSVTRQADTASGSGNSEVFNDSQGVLFANMSFNLEDSYPNLSIFNNTNATKTDNKIVIYKGATNSNQISVALRSGGSEYANITANVNVENYNKIVISYKSNEVKYYLNGFLIGTDNTVTVPIGLDTLNFDNGAGANDVYGKTKEIGYYDTALTDLELETLTSYRSLNELVTELNLKAL